MLTQREYFPPATSKLLRGARFETYEGVGVAVLHDTVVVYWSSDGNDARVRWAFATAEKARDTNPGGVLVLQLIARSSAPPDAATLRFAHQRFSELGPDIRRMVTVPLGDEFWMAIVRSIMRGVFLLGGHSRKHLVATKAEALDVLLGCATALSPTRGELVDAILELQRLLHARSW